MKWKLVPADVVTGEMVAAGIATPVANTGNDDVDRPEDYKQVFLSMLEAAPPAPSVPDEQLQAAFDRGFKAGNEQDIAQQIEIHKLHDLLAAPTPTEAPAQDFEDALEHAFWDFDARHKGYKKTIRPISERDAFKQVLRNFMHEHGGAEAPADVARDAERLDWLDVQCSENNGRHILCLPGGLRAAIDAAIERDKKGGA